MNLTTVAAAAYGLSAALYAFLALLLVTRWRGSGKRGYLLAACLACAAWAGVNAWQIVEPTLPSAGVWAIETLHDFVWLFFLLAVLSPLAEQSSAARRAVTAARLVLFGLVAIVLLSLDESRGIGALIALAGDAADVKLLGQLFLAVAGIVLIEQVLRNSPPERRTAVHYLGIALGAHFIFDFYLYSDALLFRRLDRDIWLARGLVHLVTLPLLILAVARNPDWSFPLSISRRAVLHTSALLGAGVYLLVMALAGYYIQMIGGEWGPVMRTVFLFSAGVILATLFMSARLRAHLRVLINKHFFQYRYDYREEWLKLIATLTGRLYNMPLQERVIAALGNIVDSPGGVLFLVDHEGNCKVAGHLQHPPVFPVEPCAGETLVRFLEDTRWIVDVEEFQRNRSSYGRLELPSWLGGLKDPWLIVPLIHDDRLNGFVVLVRPRAPQSLDWESLDLLKTAGFQAASYIALMLTAESLAEARQFEGFNRLSAFVIHDLKNLIAQLSLVVTNAQRHKANPAFIDDAIQTIENSVEKMNRLMAQLRLAVEPPGGGRVNLADVLAGVVAVHQRRQPAPRLDNLVGAVPVRADPDRLAAVIGHIVQNAQDATPPEGEVGVRLEVQGGTAVVVVKDNGSGMDEAFVRNRLFRPFDSTKGLAGMGIGAYECREFVKSLGGWVNVTSAPGAGTVFSIGLPVAHQQTASAGAS